MKLTFVGADHEVTGSCHCIEVGKKKILIDYGMEQGINVFENSELPCDEASVDYVFLTHAHVDHSGMLPLSGTEPDGYNKNFVPNRPAKRRSDNGRTAPAGAYPNPGFPSSGPELPD